jgi:hypothetical protein
MGRKRYTAEQIIGMLRGGRRYVFARGRKSARYVRVWALPSILRAGKIGCLPSHSEPLN